MCEHVKLTLSPFHQALKNGYISIKGDFLLPLNYTRGHEHRWITLDAGYCICQLCGWDHVCFQGNCPLVSMEHSEQICSISGCVILKTEMKPEWGAMERGNVDLLDTTNDHHRNYDFSKKKLIINESKYNHNKKWYKSGTHHSEHNHQRGRPPLFHSNRPPPPPQHPKPNMKAIKSQCKKRKLLASNPHTTYPSTFNNQKIMKGSMEVHEFVEMVVREILDSQKTLRCREEEMSRDKTRKIACLAKILRESFSSMMTVSYAPVPGPTSILLSYQRPNMIEIEAKLSWLCRKCRYHPYYYDHHHTERHHPYQQHFALKKMYKNKKGQSWKHNAPTCKKNHTVMPPPSVKIMEKRTKTLERVIGICVENISQLIRLHGWHRVNRQLQHATRGKEFVCSMLYLMRMGITFRNQNILQKVEILNDLLPMQVFLPSIFNIRAKSITEGENIIKLDIQKMPI